MTDPLWVPILTHYRDTDPATLDHGRCLAQLQHLAPHVRQLLVAGTTGDGWSMPRSLLGEWLELLRRPDLPAGTRVLVGALEPTTEEVIERACWIEAEQARAPLAAAYEGLTICPPIDPGADQERILDHYEQVIAATTSPIAVYELPQVTGCSISPGTFETLAATGRVRFFKDTSGEDRIAAEARETPQVTRLRGAEGGYAGWLRQKGPYDGWLLSTANGLAQPLRRIAECQAQGKQADADALSTRLAETVERIFDIAADVPEENAFSLANRAVDHIAAFGSNARSAPALTGLGKPVPGVILDRVREALATSGFLARGGYIAAP